MIDYVAPDVPQAVVQFADNAMKNNPPKRSSIRYLTDWKGNLELYMHIRSYENPTISNSKLIAYTDFLIYDCSKTRRPTVEEMRDIQFFIPKYQLNSKIRSEHVCHRDLEAYNQHNTPSLYNKKVKYFTPKYIPKPVVQYINEKYPVSWYPGTYNRYIKYLSTYENNYEVYFVYWLNSENKMSSMGKYVLYDCKNARGYKNNKERIDVAFLIPPDEQYSSKAKPVFCKSKQK